MTKKQISASANQKALNVLEKEKSKEFDMRTYLRDVITLMKYFNTHEEGVLYQNRNCDMNSGVTTLTHTIGFRTSMADSQSLWNEFLDDVKSKVMYFDQELPYTVTVLEEDIRNPVTKKLEKHCVITFQETINCMDCHDYYIEQLQEVACVINSVFRYLKHNEPNVSDAVIDLDIVVEKAFKGASVNVFEEDVIRIPLSSLK